jgi:transposase
MEVKKRRRFTREFKEDVVNIVKTGNKRISYLSKELEISEQLIYRWYKKYSGIETPEEKENTEKDKELRELRRKLADITEERDILKKAISIFSKQGPSN